LGGFVKSESKEVFGITCRHIINNRNEFQQPSRFAIRKANVVRTKSIDLDAFKCGQANDYGCLSAISVDSKSEFFRLLDYQLLECHRDLEVPLNNLHISDQFKVQLKNPRFDLNAMEDVDLKNIKFGKVGAATGFTIGKLSCKLREATKIRYRGKHFLN
jgi:hypothetical protein